MPNLNRFLSEVGQFGFQKPNWFEFRVATHPAWYLSNQSGKQSNAQPTNETAVFKAGVEVIKNVFAEWAMQGMVCTSVSLPGRGFATADQSIYGFERKVPYFNTYNPLQCTFVAPFDVTGTNVGYKFFQDWHNAISDTTIGSNGSSLTSGAFDMRFPSDYYAEAEIVLFSFIDIKPDPSKANLQINIRPRIGRFDFGSLSIGGQSEEERRNSQPTENQIQASLRHRFYELYPVSVEATTLNWAETDTFAQITVTFNYSYWTALEPDIDESVLRASGLEASQSKKDKFFQAVSQAAYNTAVFNGWIK